MHEIRLISAHCENFKGFKQADVQFGKKVTRIEGANGLGKSTIAELIMWTFFGVGNDLTSNPKVRREVDRIPVDDVPVVGELTLEVDGKEIIARKVQKRTTKKDKSYSDDNTYSINGVEKNLKDFIAYFDFSFDDFLMCMNIGAFLAKKPKEMREFLFKLPQDISVNDIVFKYPEFTELVDLLDKYTVEEISAMNKASITKLNKEITGYPGRIDEVNRQIVEDVDTAELELQKNAIMEQIAEVEGKEENLLSQLSELEAMSKNIMELQFRKSEIERIANRTIIEQRKELQKQVDEAEEGFRKAMNEQCMAEMDMKRIEAAIERKSQEKGNLVSEYNKVDSEKYPEFIEIPAFDESTLVCPTCGQLLPEELKVQKIADYEERRKKHQDDYEECRKTFETDKVNKLKIIAEHGNKCVAEINQLKENLDKAGNNEKKAIEQKLAFNKAKNQATEELKMIPMQADLSENQEYEALCLEIQKKEEAMRAADSGADYRAALKQKKSMLQMELDNVKNQILRVMKNAELEERIEFLRSEHAQKEQSKADCEKILDLLDELDKKKNELLVDDINAHFGGRVTWNLFAFAKNGGYKKDYCEPCIDGFPVKDTANHGRQIEAMMIIALSIQKIVGIQCPVILDDGESLDSWRLPECQSQLIVMSRTDDKTLKVEAK